MIRSTTTAGAMQAQFSPDSKFIAYAIESEGSGQVIVEPLPTTGVRSGRSRGAPGPSPIGEPTAVNWSMYRGMAG